MKSLLKKLEQVELVIVVWGNSLWSKVLEDKEIANHLNSYPKMGKAFEERVVLNNGLYISPVRNKLSDINKGEKLFFEINS